MGCEGCKVALNGKAAKAHSEKCRKKMEELLKDKPRMKEANRRGDEFVTKVIEAGAKRTKRNTEKEKG